MSIDNMGLCDIEEIQIETSKQVIKEYFKYKNRARGLADFDDSIGSDSEGDELDSMSDFELLMERLERDLQRRASGNTLNLPIF